MKPKAPKQRGLAVFAPSSDKGRALLATYRLTAADIGTAVERYVATETQTVGTLIGIGHDGLFASETRGWRPDQPGAFLKPLILIPWVQILELLGRAPSGSTGILTDKGDVPH
jgi:hypothetical protein